MRTLSFSLLFLLAACVTVQPGQLRPLTNAPTFVRSAPNANLAERDRLYRRQKLSYDGQHWLIGRRPVTEGALDAYVRDLPLRASAKDLGWSLGVAKFLDDPQAINASSAGGNLLIFGVERVSSAIAWKSLEDDIRKINASIVKDLGAEPASDLGPRPPLPEPWPQRVGFAGSSNEDVEDRWVAGNHIGAVLHPRDEIDEYMRRSGGEREAAAMQRGEQTRFFGQIAMYVGAAALGAILADAITHIEAPDHRPDWWAPVGGLGAVAVAGGWWAYQWGGSSSVKAQEDFNAKLRRSEAPGAAPAVSAEAAIQRGDYRTALQFLQATRRELGDGTQVLDRMGYCYFQLRDLPSALACYKRALVLSPHDPTAVKMVKALEAPQK
jgi:hypothetical protein